MASIVYQTPGVYDEEVPSGARPIQAVEIVDPLTIRLRTAQPYPLMPMDLSNVRILDRQTHEGAATEDYNSGRVAIGTGPWRVISHRLERRIGVDDFLFFQVALSSWVKPMG